MYKHFIFYLLPLALFANPVGEKIVFGEAVVERPSAGVLEVVQNSQSAIIEWESFSVDAQETAKFIQPDAHSSVLNRVTGANMTEIYGKMEGNGKIFLVNPYGVVVGETGVIDCANFLAAALDFDNQAFLQEENYVFQNGTQDAKVVNKGSIRAFNGPLYLIGPSVETSGTLQAAEDKVYLIRGDTVSLPALDTPKIMIRPLDRIKRLGIRSPYSLAVNTEGSEEATVVRKEGGRVFLESPSFEFVDVPNVPFANGGRSIEETLDSLQEIRSLIPERLWYQEFAWFIDVPGFQNAASSLASHRRSFAKSRPAILIGTPEYYYLHATISGEPIRIMDRYLQFLDSPYWKNPDTLAHFYYLQHNYAKVPR